MNDEINKAKKIILSFCEKLNEWEPKMFNYSRLKDGRHLSEKAKLELINETEETIGSLYVDAFEIYCTHRERKYSIPVGYSKQPKYEGVLEENIVSAELTKPNRIEIVVQTTNYFKTKYQFVLLKEAGEFKIDSVKYFDETWKIGIL